MSGGQLSVKEPPPNAAGPLLFIVGPTASGKTALAVALAERFSGEIINADSRQFYRGMDIGTAKPIDAERARAVHHLIDVLNPDEVCGLAWFLDAARAAITDIRARGRLPIICGGTGQYVRALRLNWDVPRVPPDPALRQRLSARAEAEGGARLLGELAALDPARAAQLDARNVRRVVRALEVALLRDARVEPPSDQPAPLVKRELTLGIRLERAALYERIDARVEAIYDAGLVAEVQALNAAGFGCDAPAMNAIGYREVCEHLRGVLTLAQARERTKFATHRLARTQHAWFQPLDPTITWLDAGPALVAQAGAATATYLATFD